jgi:hypothetical protein
MYINYLIFFFKMVIIGAMIKMNTSCRPLLDFPPWTDKTLLSASFKPISVKDLILALLWFLTVLCMHILGLGLIASYHHFQNLSLNHLQAQSPCWNHATLITLYVSFHQFFSSLFPCVMVWINWCSFFPGVIYCLVKLIKNIVPEP